MRHTFVLVPVVAALVLIGLWWVSLPGALVVYCAHDAVYSKEILDDFTRQTGIPVQVRFDTEATKSLGLINLIAQEHEHPRCDVFWNNELLGMVDLREQGLLEPYRGSGWNRIPEQFRDPEGHWAGFAARMRVALFNINEVSADDDTLQNLFALEPSRLAIAKPLFGTTLTHYTVLWHLWGPERLKSWHTDLRIRGIREVDGNAAVKDVVAMGSCAAGLTDNDDAFVALDEKQPVEMLPFRVPPADTEELNDELKRVRALVKGESDKSDAKSEASPAKPGQATTLGVISDHESSGYTICIPNTVGIIKGTKRRRDAERLVDFLLSKETELALANSKARQIPLGPVDRDQLPEDVRKLAEWSGAAIDLRPLLPARRECLNWLKQEYVK